MDIIICSAIAYMAGAYWSRWYTLREFNKRFDKYLNVEQDSDL